MIIDPRIRVYPEFIASMNWEYIPQFCESRIADYLVPDVITDL